MCGNRRGGYLCDKMRWKGRRRSDMKKWWKDSDIKPCVDMCEGCSKIVDGHCRAYLNPEKKWDFGWCNHNDIPLSIIEQKIKRQKDVGSEKKINPLKLSKRGGKSTRPLIHRSRHYVTANHKIGGNSSGRNNRGTYRATF